MPRLRRLRQELTYEELFPDPVETIGEEPGSSPVAGEVVQTGNSWWSNHNIITSMPDHKLREAYQRHRSLADQCQQEITRRKVEGITVRAAETFDLRYGGHVFVDVRRESRRVPSRTRKKRRSDVTLTPEQLLKAMEALLAIRRTKSCCTEGDTKTSAAGT